MIKILDGVLHLPQNAGVVLTGSSNNVDIGSSPVLYARALVIGAGITGFNGGEENRLLIVQPTRNSPEEVNLFHDNGSSSVANRLLNGQGIDQVTAFWGTAAMYIYDDVEDLWKQVG